MADQWPIVAIVATVGITPGLLHRWQTRKMHTDTDSRQAKITDAREELAAILAVATTIDDPTERQIMHTAAGAIRAQLAELEPDSPAWKDCSRLVPFCEGLSSAELEAERVTPSKGSTLYYCNLCKVAYRRALGDTKGCPNGCPLITAEQLHKRGVSLRQAVAMIDAHGRQRHPITMKREKPSLDTARTFAHGTIAQRSDVLRHNWEGLTADVEWLRAEHEQRRADLEETLAFDASARSDIAKLSSMMSRRETR